MNIHDISCLYTGYIEPMISNDLIRIVKVLESSWSIKCTSAAISQNRCPHLWAALRFGETQRVFYHVLCLWWLDLSRGPNILLKKIFAVDPTVAIRSFIQCLLWNKGGVPPRKWRRYKNVHIGVCKKKINSVISYTIHNQFVILRFLSTFQ